MPNVRKIAVRLAGLGTTALVAVAAEHLGLRHAAAEAAPAVGVLATAAGFAIEKGSAFLHTFAEASFGHIGAAFFHDAAEHLGEKEPARARENQDLHRMIGATIAHILEQPSNPKPTGFGARWIKDAAQAFRGPQWMNVELAGRETTVSEPSIVNFFSGDAEVIKHTPVLTEADWIALLEKVAPTRADQSEAALHQAAARLHQDFAFQLWESAKHAWEKNDLAWPALILRLLTELLRTANHNDARFADLSAQISSLSDAVLKQATPAMLTAPPEDKILVDAIRQNHSDLTAQLKQIESKIDSLTEAVQAALENLREAPVKERWIGLPNTRAEILARDPQAQALLAALHHDAGPSIISIAAPPGFGKSAVFALALRMEFAHAEPPPAALRGIAVLNALADPPAIATLANVLGRITGYQEAAAKFVAATAAAPPLAPPDPRLQTLFFDFLRLCGPVWLVVENAEAVLAPTASPNNATNFRELLKDWCTRDHQTKLLLLTRNAPPPELNGHHRLQAIEKELLGGLPSDAALTLLRQRLEDTRFHSTPEPLLTQIAEKLHRVPMALEQFAAYLRKQEEGINLTQHFIANNDILRLDSIDQLPRIIRENLNLLDPESLYLLRVVAWAETPIPASGMLALDPNAPELLTRLVRSNQLLVKEGTIAEGRSYDMHALIREALAEPTIEPLDFGRINEVFFDAGGAEWDQTQFRPALALFTLTERIARELGQRNELSEALMGCGIALRNLRRLEEAAAVYDESVSLRRELVEKEGRRELRNSLAMALMNRSVTLDDLGRLEEAVAAYDESISLLRELVEQEGRSELRNDLAMALMNRAVALWNLGRIEEAVQAYDEPISLRRELVEKEGRRELRNDLAMALMNHGIALQHLSRLEDAVAAYDESIFLYRELVEKEGRRELRNDLAMSIMNRAVALGNLGRLEEAVAAYDEAISLYRELVEREGRRELRDNLATSLYNLALAREKQGILPAAIEAAREARQLLEDCVKDGMKHLASYLADAQKLEALLTAAPPAD